jgi:nuclear transport factor 2 (NTF2) superfamily protein
VFYPPAPLKQGLPEYELRIAAAEGRFEDEGWRPAQGRLAVLANVVITALRDDKGVLRGFAKVTRDLTQRREHEETLRKAKNAFVCGRRPVRLRDFHAGRQRPCDQLE